MTEPARLLILSFSPIASDARVLKQVARLVPDYQVTTCGYGPTPPGVAHHIQIPDTARSDDLYGRYITLRLYRRAYERIGAVAWCREHLTPGQWDIVLANDVESVPVALGLAPRLGVHADLHEYTPRLHDEVRAWDRRIRPFWEFVCRRWVAKADSWTTVGRGLADEYRRQFGFEAQLATNAAPFVDLEPGPAQRPLRLVHSGACLRNRNLMAMIDGVASSTADVTLDLYLMGNDPGYFDELSARAVETGRVRVLGPVPYEDLVATLHGYDLGIHLLPPTNFNNRWALPNKLFDYVQARLGVIVGPSVEMRAYVEDSGIGALTEDFTSDALARLLNSLSVADVDSFKKASHAAARDLSAERQVEVWAAAIAKLAQRGVA